LTIKLLHDIQCGGGKQMAEVRFIEEAEKDFGAAFEMTDIREAILLIGKWVGKPIKEIEKVVSYNVNTGEPKKKKFVPYEVWNGRIWLDVLFSSPNLSKRDCEVNKLYTVLTEKIPVGCGVLVDGIVAELLVSEDRESNHYLRVFRPKIL
jgi:hypothetical protein